MFRSLSLIRSHFLICIALSFPALVVAESPNPTTREITVTTLADYQPGQPPIHGSLRWAIMQKGPSIIRFSVAGNIDLLDKLVIRQPYVAIDGSTAPGDGVTLQRIQVEVTDTHDVVLRYLRFRCADGFSDDKARRKIHYEYDTDGPRAGGWRSLLIYGTKKMPTHNVLVENCSIQNSTDDNAAVWGNCRGIVFRKCLISGGYVKATKGLLTGVDPGQKDCDYPDYVSVDRCLFAFEWSRTPDLNGGIGQIVNNVIVGTAQGGILTHSRCNVVNNSCWSRIDHPWGPNADRQLVADVAPTAPGAFYISGNYMNGLPASTKAVGVKNKAQTDLPESLLRKEPWPGLPLDILPVLDAQGEVLRDAGCTMPRRDKLDEEVIRQVKARIERS